MAGGATALPREVRDLVADRLDLLGDDERSIVELIAHTAQGLPHGWDDEQVSYEDSARFAREHGASLHLLHDDHRLHGQMNMIRYLFEYFLISLDMPASGE